MIENIKGLIQSYISTNNIGEKINRINELREFIHDISPFKNEPVDFVKWVLSDNVVANDYNPNKVAPPEMELLEVSILNDGYTQPKSEAYAKYKSIIAKRKLSSEIEENTNTETYRLFETEQV